MAGPRHRVTRLAIAALFAVSFVAAMPHVAGARQHTRSAALQACSSIKKGGTFTYGVDQDTVSFDSNNTQDNGSLWADMNVYDQLVRLSPDATHLEPDLAQSWQVQNHGTVYIFHLRPNAKFWDGTPVTAQDVVWTWTRVMNPKAVNNFTLVAVKSVKALNAHTVKVTLKSPWAPFLNDITLWGASIWSEKGFKHEGASAFIKRPIGSGPFYVAKFLPGNYVLLNKNKYYWEKDACGNQMPYLDSVKLQYLPNDNTRLLKLQTGAIDAMIDLPYNLIATVSANPNLVAKQTPQFGVYAISLNQKKYPYFRDHHVVAAMNEAIDRNAIVKSVFYGHATPAGSPIDKGVDFYNPTWGYHYNLADAKKQMAKSKYPHGFKTVFLVVSGNTQMNAVAVIMQQELKQIGITMQIQALDGTTEFQEQQKETYQMAIDYGTSDNIDPNENMSFCCLHDGGADSGYTGWNNPAADALYHRSQKAVNVAQRTKLLNQWQKIILQQLPVMWILYPDNSFAFRKNVHDFSVQKTAHWDLWPVWKS
jgi:peptide/nickel transport system substrate-binding protein